MECDHQWEYAFTLDMPQQGPSLKIESCKRCGVQQKMAPVLDVCCGSRMMWYDRNNPLALFCDIRRETLTLCDGRILEVNPDQIADFTCLPFEDESFYLVVFDPPHLVNLSKKSWLCQKYGTLLPDWRDEISEGFSECFRVLKPNGTLVFKWSESDIPLSEVISLSPIPPLFGNNGIGVTAPKTHWICFFKS